MREAGWFNMLAGLVFGPVLVLLGVLLGFHQSGVEIDDERRLVREWRRWRGRPRRVVETPFAEFTRLRLVWTRGGRCSPGRWQVLAARNRRPAVEIGSALKLAVAVPLAAELSARTGIRFPEGQTSWTGTHDGVHCDVALGDTGLTVGEYGDNPHDANQATTASLDELTADAKPEPAARAVIRERLGAAVLEEILAAVTLRRKLRDEK
ncbi:MAG: hypothetical protein QM775_36815 [Pirellulales bacterium]